MLLRVVRDHERVGPVFPRRIAHFDLDSFFVAVARLDDASLIGRPVLVGYDGRRGVVSSASYEARAFGCHAGQPMAEARRLCPQALVVSLDFSRYAELSHRFHNILRDISPVVESMGLDEAYGDLTGLPGPTQGGQSPAGQAAEAARRRTRDELGLPVSACVASTRAAAKVGSDRAKPDGLIEIPPGGDAAFLAPLPLRELPLVGPSLGGQLAAAGVRTIGDAAALDSRWLERRFGKAGQALSRRARGNDDEPVHGGRRAARSISREVTFAEDVVDLAILRAAFRRQAEEVGEDLRREGKRARTVHIRARWPDFTTCSRSRTVSRPLQANHDIARAAEALLDEVFRAEGWHPVRLVGLGVSNLVEDSLQLGFEDVLAGRTRLPGPPRPSDTRTGREIPAAPRGDERLDRTIDGLRRRFGATAVLRGPDGKPNPRGGFVKDQPDEKPA